MKAMFRRKPRSTTPIRTRTRGKPNARAANGRPKFGETLGWMTDKLIIGAANNWSRGSLLWNLALDPAAWPAQRRLRRLPRRGHDRSGDRSDHPQRRILCARPRQPLRPSRRIPGRDRRSATRGRSGRHSSTATAAGSRSSIAIPGDGPVTIAIDGGRYAVPLASGSVATLRWGGRSARQVTASRARRAAHVPRLRRGHDACSSPGASSPRTTIR